MIIESGVIVALGLILAFWKCSWKWRMRMISYPLTMDILVFIVLNYLHAGTFSGVMVAAVGSLVCSAMISLARYVFGYTSQNKYFAGVFNVYSRLV